MEKQHAAELENSNQIIASLRKKIVEKDQEINVDYEKNLKVLFVFFY
jgi:hypothetical protein